MIEICKTCKFYIDHYTSIIPLGTEVAVLNEEEKKTIECRRLAIEVDNESGTGICGNKYSELSGCGVHDGGWCDNYMTRTNNSNESASIGERQ